MSQKQSRGVGGICMSGLGKPENTRCGRSDLMTGRIDKGTGDGDTYQTCTKHVHADAGGGSTSNNEVAGRGGNQKTRESNVEMTTDLRLPIVSSVDSPWSFLFRDGGLDAREHSEPLTWHGMQPSSSLRTQLAREYRQARHGGTGEPPARSVEAPAGRLLPWPDSNLWKLSWRWAAGSNRGGLGAMAMGAVRWTDMMAMLRGDDLCSRECTLHATARRRLSWEQPSGQQGPQR